MKISTHVAMLLALVMAQNAAAIQVVGEQSQAAAPSSQTAGNEREGAIDKIDLSGRIMVVGGVRYLFSAATTPVHGASPLALGKNDRVRFKVLNESGTERIIEIWLITAAKH
jgi:hypothetical protein